MIDLSLLKSHNHDRDGLLDALKIAIEAQSPNTAQRLLLIGAPDYDEAMVNDTIEAINTLRPLVVLSLSGFEPQLTKRLIGHWRKRGIDANPCLDADICAKVHDIVLKL